MKVIELKLIEGEEPFQELVNRDPEYFELVKSFHLKMTRTMERIRGEEFLEELHIGKQLLFDGVLIEETDSVITDYIQYFKRKIIQSCVEPWVDRS